MLRMSPNRSCSSRRAFTLIELLVVIAIIAILAAILFPVFVSAKANARTTRCQSNLKQIAVAATRYTDDWNGVLPPTYFTGQASLYGRYLGKRQVLSTDKDTVLMCPPKQAYAWNFYLMGPLNGVPNSGNWGMPNCDLQMIVGYGPPTYIAPGRTIGSVKSPSKTPCSIDAFVNSTVGWGWAVDDAFNKSRMLNMHNGGSNYAFVDGHVKWYKPAGAVTPGGKEIYIAYVGLDYDGDGRLGTDGTIR